MVADGDAVRFAWRVLATAAARATTAALIFGFLGWKSVGLGRRDPGASIAVRRAALRGRTDLPGPDLGTIGRSSFSTAPDAEPPFALPQREHRHHRPVRGPVSGSLGIYASSTRLQLLGGIMNQAATGSSTDGSSALPRRRRTPEGDRLAPFRARWRSVGLLSLALIAAAAEALPRSSVPAHPIFRLSLFGLAVADPLDRVCRSLRSTPLPLSAREASGTAMTPPRPLRSAGLLALGPGRRGVGFFAFVIAAGACSAAALGSAFSTSPPAPLTALYSHCEGSPDAALPHHPAAGARRVRPGLVLPGRRARRLSGPAPSAVARSACCSGCSAAISCILRGAGLVSMLRRPLALRRLSPSWGAIVVEVACWLCSPHHRRAPTLTSSGPSSSG